MGENNENGLPANRQAVVEAGLAQFQTIAAERDALANELAHMKSDLAAQKVANEAMSAQLNNMESRIQSMTLVRDQAVADRAIYEALFISIQAQMRAFQIPAAPLVKDIANEEYMHSSDDFSKLRDLSRSFTVVSEPDRS